jgi:MFS family permease
MSHIINLSLLFRNKNFGWLYAGQFVSMLGTALTNVILPYQIYTLTHSTAMVGLLSLLQLLPLLFTALLGGVLADRCARRSLLIRAEIFLSLGSLLLMLNTLPSTPSLWLIFIVAPLMSGVTGLHRPALEGSVQQLVKVEDLAQVSVLSSFKYSVCTIGGSAFAGILLAWVGLTFTFLVDVFSFAFSLFCLLRINIPLLVQEEKVASVLKSLKEGCRYALSRQELMGSYWVDFVAMIFGMPIALIPAIVANAHEPSMLGFFYAAPAVGALIICCFSQWTMKIKRHGAAIAISATVWGVCILFFGLFHHLLWLGLFFFALAGAADQISGIFRSTLWNETIPSSYRGRLAGIEMISYLSGPKLGDAEAGFVASFFGIGFSIISGGVLCVAGVVLCCALMPKFWSYRSTIKQDEHTNTILEDLSS